MQFRN
jgi:hypothetical protein